MSREVLKLRVSPASNLAKALLAFALVVLFNSCSDPCAIPMEQAPRLRILNAMADEPVIKVLINGRTVYDALQYSDQKQYNGLYSDGSQLPLGGGQSLAVLDRNNDTILKTFIDLSDRPQTLIIAGRARQRVNLTPAPPRAIMLEDEGTGSSGTALVRFVHAMPDLDSIDIYFTSDYLTIEPHEKLAYGEVTERKSLSLVNGLVVTKSGDKNEVVMLIQKAGLPIPPTFFGTTVIRGTTDPHGPDEPLPSPVVLWDIDNGLTLFSIESIFVRFFNGTRDSALSLLPKGSIDAGPRDDVNGQLAVMCIQPDSASTYFSITPLFHGTADWHFAAACPPQDWKTIYRPFIFRATLQKKRYTIAAMHRNKRGEADTLLTHMLLEDTLSTPKDKNFGTVRFVNLSPDADVTIRMPDNSTRVLRQGETPIVAYYPNGAQSFTTNGKQVNFTVAADDPKTVWFSAATNSDPLPYNVTSD
jgi:hypothetical protein